MTEPIGHGVERLVLGWLAGGSKRGERAAMETAVGADHRVSAAATELARQLQRRLVGLRTAVTEKDLASLAGDFREKGVDLNGRATCVRVGEEVADMQQRVGLTGDRLGDDGVRMTQRGDGEPAQKIEVSLAVGVPQLGALAPCEHDLRGTKDRDERAVISRDAIAESRCIECVRAHLTIVPIPSSVKTSNSSTCGMRPSRMCEWRTPLRTA